jgi:carbon storage regulator
MLVLSRHRDERIMIGNDIVITIVDIRSDKVRVGIEAPKDLPVHREEIYNLIQRGVPQDDPSDSLSRSSSSTLDESGASASIADGSHSSPTSGVSVGDEFGSGITPK